MTQNSFILYTSYYKLLDHLTIEERGFLWTAVFEYMMKKEETALPPKVSVAFELIKNQLEVDQEKYEKIIERNRKNGVKHKKKVEKDTLSQPLETQSSLEKQGEIPLQKPSGFFGMPNDNDNDNDNENDNGNDNRIVKGRRKGFASLGEILSASPFSSPENGAPPVRAQGAIVGAKGDGPEQGMTSVNTPAVCPKTPYCTKQSSLPPLEGARQRISPSALKRTDVGVRGDGQEPPSPSSPATPLERPILSPVSAPPNEHLPEHPISVLHLKKPPESPPYEPLPSDWMLPERLNNLCLKFLNQSKVMEAKNAYIRECNRRGFRSDNSETGFVSYLKRYLFETTVPLTDSNVRSVENLIDTLKKEVYSWT